MTDPSPGIDWNEVLFAQEKPGDPLYEFLKEFWIAAADIVQRKEKGQAPFNPQEKV